MGGVRIDVLSQAELFDEKEPLEGPGLSNRDLILVKPDIHIWDSKAFLLHESFTRRMACMRMPIAPGLKYLGMGRAIQHVSVIVAELINSVGDPKRLLL